MSGEFFVDSNIWLYAFMDDTSPNMPVRYRSSTVLNMALGYIADVTCLSSALGRGRGGGRAGFAPCRYCGQ